jgi:aminopeptidase S
VPPRSSDAWRRYAGWGGAVAAAVAVLVACTSTGPTSPEPAARGPLHSQLVQQVSGAGALTHAEALQQIADRNGGNRATPGPGYDASVDYVVGVLRDAGFDVSTPTFVLRQRGGGRETVVRNVIAQTRTGSAEHVVMAGAHLDSVPEGPGINDNASGVATLLEVATRMGSSPPIPNVVRFGFWGAEERNLNGSKSYVESLSDSEREAIALYLNLDMVASPNAGYFVQGGADGPESRSGPPGSATVGRVLVDELAANGIAADLMRFEGDSDYAPFVDADIPSGGVLAGDSNKKTTEQADRWGGRVGDVFDACYHSACDRIETLDRTALDKFSDAIAGTIARFADAAEVPAR